LDALAFADRSRVPALGSWLIGDAPSDPREGVIGVSMVFAVLVCCGSPSDHKAGTASDGGGSGDAAISYDGGETCNSFGAPSCAQGRTCCLSSLFNGVCQDVSVCTSSVQFECGDSRHCRAGMVCCATIPLALDPSFIPLDGGLWQLPMGVSVTSFCSSACSAPNFSLCVTGAECTDGTVCSQLPEGAPILLALGVETLGACLLPDGGLLSSEGGAPEGGTSLREASDARTD
jgi:hypothetical protein